MAREITCKMLKTPSFSCFFHEILTLLGSGAAKWVKDKDLYNIQAKNRNYLFELLENYNNNEFVDTSNENITVEHIFPRNPNEEWSNDISHEEYNQFKEKYLNTIGNLTLSGYNGPLSNHAFSIKKVMNNADGKQGYIYSRLWLNSYLKEIDNWDIVNFEKRLEIISYRFMKIWEYPDVEIDIIDSSEEQNIFDAETPTFKKLEYFIFENNKVEEEAVARMYFYVIRNLYTKNSQLLLSNQDILKITRNPSDFRSAQEIINGWFIEANIDNNSKFSILKKLLKLYELEDELYIKYLSGVEEKSEPNRFGLRRKFWQQLLPQIKDTNIFSNVSPSKDYWLSSGAGIGGVNYAFVISKSFVRIELAIATSSKEKNKSYFKKLIQNIDDIENTYGGSLIWEELPDNKMSRIKIEKLEVNILNENDWPVMIEFLLLNLTKFENALQPFIKKLK